MVELFEGKLGSGKTFNVVLRIASHLGRGGIVFTNVEILWEGMCALVASLFRVQIVREQLRYLDLDGIKHFHRQLAQGTREMPVLCVLDEIDLWFNSRDFGQSDKECRMLFEFVKLSRKAKIDLIFIAQSVVNMDRQFVRQAQYIWRFKDMAKVRMPLFGGLFGKLLGGYILCFLFDYDGRTCLEKKWVKKDPRVFASYNTDAVLKSVEIPGEVANPFSLSRVTPATAVSAWIKRLFSNPRFRGDLKAVLLGLVLATILAVRLYL